jgi:hypothetical protein
VTDLDLIRDFRADVPTPDGARLTAGRARLLITVTAERPFDHRHPSRSWRLAGLGATAAVAVAVAVGFLVVPATRPTAKHVTEATARPSASSLPVPVSQAEFAARILTTAASTVTRAPVKSEPAPGQWIYHKTVQYGRPGVVSPAGVSTSEEWITFDGSRTAYYQGGQLIVHDTAGGAHATGLSPVSAFNANATPKTAYDAIASLPDAPNALLAVVDKAIAQDGGIASVAAGSPISAVAPRTKGQGEFDYLVLLLWNAAAGVGAPPAAQAAAYRAMAIIPGVTIQQGITDAAGAKAIGVSADGGDHQILLDPVTYQVTGLLQLSTGIGPITLAPGLSPAIVNQISAKIASFRGNVAARDKFLQELVAKHEAIEQRPPQGTLVLSLAYATVTEVANPGAR